MDWSHALQSSDVMMVGVRNGSHNLGTADFRYFEGIPSVRQHVNVDLSASPSIIFIPDAVQQRVIFSFFFVHSRSDAEFNLRSLSLDYLGGDGI